MIEMSSIGMVGGYVTLDAIRGPIQAYSRILEESSPNDSVTSTYFPSNHHDEAYENFLRELRKRRRSGAKTTIVIDEVDAILREGFSDAQLFVSRLREVANDRDRFGMTFIFISRRSLDMIQGAVDCSTLAGLCEVIYLQPLDRNGLDELSSRSPVSVTNTGRDALWQITGGHPFLAEVVMCEAVENGYSLLDDTSIEAAQHKQSHEFTNQYRQLASLLSYDHMFEALCDLVVGPRWRAIEPHTVGLLKHYGILRSSDEVIGGVKCMSQHFHEYLALLSRTTPSWVLLGDTERQLRYLIQDRMISTYGQDWFEKLRNKYPEKNDSLTKLLQQRVREKQMFGDAASDFILDYAYISDLEALVFAEWEQYRSVLGGTKVVWKQRLHDIIKVRNPMAHHRPVPADDLQEAERSCNVLLSRLKGEERGQSL